MVRISSSVLAAEMESEIVLLNSESGKYYALNPIGRIIWEGIASNDSLNEIAERIRGKYQIEDGDDIMGDIFNLINELLELGLLEHEAGEANAR